MPVVFCPVCAGLVTLQRIPVITIQRHVVYGPSIEFKIAHAVVCEGCSLVSEVSARTGQLIDLGNIALADLDCPFVAGVDEPRVFLQSSSTLSRRSDS